MIENEKYPCCCSSAADIHIIFFHLLLRIPHCHVFALQLGAHRIVDRILAAVLVMDRCISAAHAMAVSPRIEAVIGLRVRLSSDVVELTDFAWDGDAFFAKMAKKECWVRKVLTDKVDADDGEKILEHGQLERKCLWHSKILETLMALRDEEVERIKQDAQSKAEAANQVDDLGIDSADKQESVCDIDVDIPRIGTVQAPCFPGVPNVGNMKVFLEKTRCLWIELSKENVEYLQGVVAYEAKSMSAEPEKDGCPLQELKIVGATWHRGKQRYRVCYTGVDGRKKYKIFSTRETEPPSTS